MKLNIDIKQLAWDIEVWTSDVDPYGLYDATGSFQPSEDGYEETLDMLRTIDGVNSFIEWVTEYLDEIELEDDLYKEGQDILSRLNELSTWQEQEG